MTGLMTECSGDAAGGIAIPREHLHYHLLRHSHSVRCVARTGLGLGVFRRQIVGYMNYDLTHYYIHHGRPTLSFYKKLRAHHNKHHNKKYKDRKFGEFYVLGSRF